VSSPQLSAEQEQSRQDPSNNAQVCHSNNGSTIRVDFF
jgi:hypothetical protein